MSILWTITLIAIAFVIASIGFVIYKRYREANPKPTKGVTPPSSGNKEGILSSTWNWWKDSWHLIVTFVAVVVFISKLLWYREANMWLHLWNYKGSHTFYCVLSALLIIGLMIAIQAKLKPAKWGGRILVLVVLLTAKSIMNEGEYARLTNPENGIAIVPRPSGIWDEARPVTVNQEWITVMIPTSGGTVRSEIQDPLVHVQVRIIGDAFFITPSGVKTKEILDQKGQVNKLVGRPRGFQYRTLDSEPVKMICYIRNPG